jgi:ribose transport system substrate-binding protein
MPKLRAIAVIAVIAAAAVFAATRPAVSELFRSSGDESIYVVLKTTGPHMEFWQIVRAGIQEAATEYDVDPKIVGPRYEKNVEKQIKILSGVIEQEPDAILLAASDYNRLVPLAEKAARKGITIVTLDSALNSDVPVSFVATDNVTAGKKAGREIDRLVAREKKIAILSHIEGVATAIDREQGVRQALSDRPDNLILGTFYSQNDHERAYDITERLLAQHSDLGGIIALNENSTVGAARALSDLEASEQVKLVGFDNSQEEIEFLEDGVIRALVVQKPFNMGYLGIRTLVRAARGQDVSSVIHTDAVLVRRENMLTEENQKLLFPIVQERDGTAPRR